MQTCDSSYKLAIGESLWVDCNHLPKPLQMVRESLHTPETKRGRPSPELDEKRRAEGADTDHHASIGRITQHLNTSPRVRVAQCLRYVDPAVHGT
jgi:hypothetical protein